MFPEGDQFVFEESLDSEQIFGIRVMHWVIPAEISLKQKGLQCVFQKRDATLLKLKGNEHSIFWFMTRNAAVHI